jgi:hypothetical protein
MSFISVMHQTYHVSVQIRKINLNLHFSLTSSKQPVRHKNCLGKLPNSFRISYFGQKMVFWGIMYRIWPTYIEVYKFQWRSFNLILLSLIIISYIFLTIFLFHLLLYTYVFFPVLVVGNEI